MAMDFFGEKLRRFLKKNPNFFKKNKVVDPNKRQPFYTELPGAKVIYRGTDESKVINKVKKNNRRR